MDNNLEKQIQASEIPVVEFFISDAPNEDFKISIVKSPAIKQTFLKFTEEEENEIFQFKTQNEEQRIVSGPVMIPNLLMERKELSTNKYYQGYFKEDSIKNALLNLLAIKDRKFNIEHSPNEFAEAKLFEAYLLSDTLKNENFKDLPNSTLMVSLMLDQFSWDTYVKTGKVLGFSIETILQLIPIKFSDYLIETKNIQPEMENKKEDSLIKSITESIKSFFAGDAPAPDAQTSTPEIKKGDALSLPDGAYKITVTGSVIDEIVPLDAEGKPKSNSAEERKAVKDNTIESENNDSNPVIPPGFSAQEFEEKIKSLEEKFEAANKENEDLKLKLEEAKKPNPVKVSDTKGEFTSNDDKFSSIRKYFKNDKDFKNAVALAKQK